MDNVFIWGSTAEEHETPPRLAVLWKAALMLNEGKCCFNVQELTSLGHEVNEHGIHPDDAKFEAVKMMSPPISMPELQRMLG